MATKEEDAKSIEDSGDSDLSSDELVKQETADKAFEKAKKALDIKPEDEFKTYEALRQEVETNIQTRRVINGYKILSNLISQPDQKYCVVAYFLLNPPMMGKPRGMWLFVGTYHRRKLALKTVKDLRIKTGIVTIYATRTCDWQMIDEEDNQDRTNYVPEENDQKEEMVSDRRKEDHEKRLKEFNEEEEKGVEMDEEIENEKDVNSIEYYTRRWFLTIRARAELEDLRLKMDKATKRYNDSVKTVRELYKDHPEHEEAWIPILEKKLPKRGETHILDMIKIGHGKLAAEVLEI